MLWWWSNLVCLVLGWSQLWQPSRGGGLGAEQHCRCQGGTLGSRWTPILPVCNRFWMVLGLICWTSLKGRIRLQSLWSCRRGISALGSLGGSVLVRVGGGSERSVLRKLYPFLRGWRTRGSVGSMVTMLRWTALSGLCRLHGLSRSGAPYVLQIILWTFF